jgi:uncharacterized repeat protein (TIGR02543 family)
MTSPSTFPHPESVEAPEAEKVKDTVADEVKAPAESVPEGESAKADDKPAEDSGRGGVSDAKTDDKPLDIPAFANDLLVKNVADAVEDAEPKNASEEIKDPALLDDNTVPNEPADSANDSEKKPAKNGHGLTIVVAILVVVAVLLGIRSCTQPYKVTYDNGDGTSYTASYPIGETINVDTVKKPVRNGYTFAGWYSDKALTKEVHEIDQSSSITLYAKWIPDEYRILYSGMPGGADVDDQDTYVTGEHKALPTYEKEHYTFVGWRVGNSDTVIMELSGTETGNLNLEAVYEPETYTITYITDGIVEDPIATYQYGDSFNLPVSVMDGATFDGWYTDMDRKEPITGVTTETFGDLTVYAKFNKADVKNETPAVDYSGVVDGKITSTKNDLGVSITADTKDQATANAIDIVYSSLCKYTADARKKIGTVHISDHDGVSGSDIYVNRSSSAISAEFNADIFRILCSNKDDSFRNGWDDYTSFINSKAASGSRVDDAAETWGWHMAGVYGDDQVLAKFGILYNVYGSYLN